MPIGNKNLTAVFFVTEKRSRFFVDQNQAFALRVQRIIEVTSNLGESEVNQMLFINAEHKKRFQSICKSGLFPNLNESYGYAAAIFLLSADAFVWSKARSNIDRGLIHFENIRIHSVDLDWYAILHMAKELYSETRRLRFA